MITGRVAELILEELKITPRRVAHRKYEDLVAAGQLEFERVMKDSPAEDRASAEHERSNPPRPFAILRDAREA